MRQQPMKCAWRMPEVLGGLAIGDRPQRSGWEVGDHRQLAPIATRIPALKAARVNLVLPGLLHFLQEVELIGPEAIPRVRELERQTATVNHV